jgi:hypothetical protein
MIFTEACCEAVRGASMKYDKYSAEKHDANRPNSAPVQRHTKHLWPGGTFTQLAGACDDHLYSHYDEANDYIYWRGGICDRVFYDSGLANPLVTLVDPEVVAITNNTHWQPFLEPLPRHVVQFQNVIEFVISPWENL